MVIAMRYAAIREISLNTEAQKPSLEEILEFNGLRIERTIEATPHQMKEAVQYRNSKWVMQMRSEPRGFLPRSS